MEPGDFNFEVETESSSFSMKVHLVARFDRLDQLQVG